MLIPPSPLAQRHVECNPLGYTFPGRSVGRVRAPNPTKERGRIAAGLPAVAGSMRSALCQPSHLQLRIFLSAFAGRGCYRMKPMPDDADLLRRYARDRAEDAFAELVRRHIDLVYSAALRQVDGDAHRAQDVAQSVFAALARKATRLAEHPSLPGWLYTSTHHAAAQVRRAERRRQAREQEALAMQVMLGPPEPDADWERLRPLLDDTMHALGGRDREAVLLRFFAGQPFAEIGARLGLTEEAARKRVERALDRLRALLAARGVTSTSAALGLLLANQAVLAAPAAVTAEVTVAALSAAVAGGGTTAAIVGFLAMAKTQFGIAGALAGVLAITALVQYQTYTGLRDDVAALRQDNARQTATLAAAERQMVELRATLAAMPLPAAVKAPAQKPMAEQTEAQRLAQLLKKGMLDTSYAALFRRLKLNPQTLDALKELLVERQTTDFDIMRVIRERGLSPDDDVSYAMWAKLQAVATHDVDERIRALLGEEGFRRFSPYANSEGQHQTYEDLAAHLRYTDSPLTDDQVDRLVALTAAGRAVQFPDRDAVPPETFGWMIPDSVVTEAESFLSPRQMDSLRKLKEWRDGRVQITAMNRAAAVEGRLKLTQDVARYYPYKQEGGAAKP